MRIHSSRKGRGNLSFGDSGHQLEVGRGSCPWHRGFFRCPSAGIPKPRPSDLPGETNVRHDFLHSSCATGEFWVYLCFLEAYDVSLHLTLISLHKKPFPFSLYLSPSKSLIIAQVTSKRTVLSLLALQVPVSLACMPIEADSCLSQHDLGSQVTCV